MKYQDLIEEFEATKPYPAWINADIYPDGKIYSREFTEWLAQKVTDLRPNQSTECFKTPVVGASSDQCKHINETVMKGKDFTIVFCADCGKDL